MMDPVIQEAARREFHIAREHLNDLLGDWCESEGWPRLRWLTLSAQARRGDLEKLLKAVDGDVGKFWLIQKFIP